MLITAACAHAHHQGLFDVSPVEPIASSPNLNTEFLVALREVGLGRAPGKRADWRSDCRAHAADQPDLQGLAADFWAALSSRDLVLDVPPADARLIADLPLQTWAALRELVRESGEGALSQASFGPELAQGSATMAQGLRLLGVKHLELRAPVSSRAMYFNASRSTFDEDTSPWRPTIDVFCTESDTLLQDIYVNDGSVVVGHGLDGLDVTVHYTDEQGYVLRSSPLQVRSAEPTRMELLFADLHQSRRGRVLDLSGWTGEQAQAVLALTQSDWKNWRASLWKDVLDMVLVGPDLDTMSPLIDGVYQLCTLDVDAEVDAGSPSYALPLPPAATGQDAILRADRQTRDAFFQSTGNVQDAFPDFVADEWFDRLLDAIDPETGTTLDLSECPQEVVDVLHEFTPAAWDAIVKHPDAKALSSIFMSPELYRGGLLPVGLAQFLA
ncbi:hypothetical protein [Caenimonas sp. SL110]|uniref:hypothetical protein n=1 Tax=Caenimonas sp. SL110 TaxID=1450524 RepID=UPI00128D2A9B|nr:hypothetical protein [Caenimonas sp. SL110]